MKIDLRLNSPLMRLRLGFAGGGARLVVVGVHKFGQDFSGMSAGIVVVCMHHSLPLAPLFSAVPGVDVLVVVVVEVLVLVEMGFRHVQNFPLLFT